MNASDSLLPRPLLTNPGLLSATLETLGGRAASATELWRMLTDNFTVDLDAVAEALHGRDAEAVRG